ncbi:MAG: serine/threonine protein kinase, partial [Proteobacteria bacterium]
MAFHPHRFGRYIIVDPIAVGGMAEIYRARVAASKEGPDRVIVIKKVIANLQQNEEFLQMFEEEIKITVGLTHPNIIQIYDYGQAEEQYFMAMEYVEGKNLRQFVKRLADMKSMFSIDMSCHIISNVCHALAYAHAYRDRMSGKPLGIVHRDISPQNVMISYDGAVKLFDFGIAKAKSASEATRAGVIKGKPSYLSPEQINGEELDGRSDIFALGIVLWELLTAKRLFVAETDMGVLRLIQSAKIEPPSTFNPAVPAALDAIVLKSLHRDRTKRYQGSEEFQRDLHKFLYSFNPNF